MQRLVFGCIALFAVAAFAAKPLAAEDPYGGGGGGGGGMMMPPKGGMMPPKGGMMPPKDGMNGGTNMGGTISNAQLAKIMPGASAAKIAQYAPYLNQAMQQAGINTPARQAAFLAQLGHESGSFKYMQELASGKAYEGRKDLGNTQPGDGVKYKGRGPIQITGRANYAAAGKALGIDLINHPELAATPQVGFQTAAWYWNTHNLNQYADKNTQAGFDKITKIINGGYNGKADRDARWNTAKQQLGVK
jgi:putative chitinase